MRQKSILEPFGFTEKETTELLQKCRMFSDVESTIEICEKYGFVFQNRKDFERNEDLTFCVITMKKQPGN